MTYICISRLPLSICETKECPQKWGWYQTSLCLMFAFIETSNHGLHCQMHVYTWFSISSKFRPCYFDNRCSIKLNTRDCPSTFFFFFFFFASCKIFLEQRVHNKPTRKIWWLVDRSDNKCNHRHYVKLNNASWLAADKEPLNGHTDRRNCRYQKFVSNRLDLAKII